MRSTHSSLNLLPLADADDLYRELADPVLLDALDDEPPASADELRERLAAFVGSPHRGSERWLTWTVRAGTGVDVPRVVGSVDATVHKRSRAASLGFCFGADAAAGPHPAEALARAAEQLARRFGVTSLEVETTRGNAPAAKLLRGLGFRNLRPDAEVALWARTPAA